MPRELRAQRYLTQSNEAVGRFIMEQLKLLDYRETMEWYRAFVPRLDHMTRALLGCNDRFFLLTGIMRRRDALHPWLFDRCREVERDSDGFLDLWARYHFKSSFITTGGSIQEILCDPEITIAILSNVKPIARAFLRQIKNEFENNQYMRALYSDVLWERPKVEAPKWSEDDGLVVKRRGNPKESTIEAHGLIDGQPTSKHFDLLVYDDIITDRSIGNPAVVRKTTIAWEASDNLGKAAKTRKWHAGTRWSFGDTYGQILDDKRLKARIYPATDDGTLKGKPVYMTPERWADVKRTQKSTVSAQMLLNPVAGNDALFRCEWFKTYTVYPTMMNVYIMCDPAKRKRKSGRKDEADRTAIAVVGVDANANKYLLDGFRHRMRLSSRYEFLKRLHRKWSEFPGVAMVKVGYEQYGAQVDTEVIEEAQLREGNYFEIHELNFPLEGGHSKTDRMERLEPDMKAGRWYMSISVWHPDIVNGGECFWTVWTNDDQQAFERKSAEEGAPNKVAPFNVGQIIYRPAIGPTKQQQKYIDEGLHYRVPKPIKRVDEDGVPYDLTRCFMEEARLVPFAPHDDLVDACSRIYDLDPQKPVEYEGWQTQPLEADLERRAMNELPA